MLAADILAHRRDFAGRKAVAGDPIVDHRDLRHFGEQILDEAIQAYRQAGRSRLASRPAAWTIACRAAGVLSPQLLNDRFGQREGVGWILVVEHPTECRQETFLVKTGLLLGQIFQRFQESQELGVSGRQQSEREWHG